MLTGLRPPSWVQSLLLPAVNLLFALAAAAAVVLAVGESPWVAMKVMAEGAFGSAEGLSYTLFYATNFIFTGLAVALAFQAGLFNIGAEGQAALGGLGAALAALGLGPHLPSTVVLPLCVLSAALLIASAESAPPPATALRHTPDIGASGD